jgi:predicted GNAT superfamily acetyltransferase
MATHGASESTIIIRSIDRISEMRKVEELQREVWGPDDVVPMTHLRATTEVGGILIGAFDEERLVAFVYGFIGQEQGHIVIHSHMLAVKGSYRDHDLGYRLKLAQREAALRGGVTRITWTFDPLQSRNAHLNFAKLGVVADQYKIDFYGEESPSPLHHHIGTDRLWVSWRLDSRRVRQRLEERSSAGHTASPPVEEAITLVRLEADGSPGASPLAEGLGGEQALIEIPGHIGSLQQHAPELATRWREATRRAFVEALDAGYLVAEFYRQARNGLPLGVYLLKRPEGEESN